MNEKQEFIDLISRDDFEALKAFDANQANVLNLFTCASDVKSLFQLKAITVHRMVSEGGGRLQQLITKPSEFYELYAIKPKLAVFFFICAETHFKSVFQNLEDVTKLALLDTSCALGVLLDNAALYQNAQICESLFELAAKEIPVNPCLILLRYVPMRNISQEDFEKLYNCMKENSCIEDNQVEEWKEKYLYDNSSMLSAIGFFAMQVAEGFAASVKKAGQSLSFNSFNQ